MKVIHYPLSRWHETNQARSVVPALRRAHSWAGRTDTQISGCNVLGLSSSGRNKMLWQYRIESEDSGRGHGGGVGRGSAEEMTFELGLKGWVRLDQAADESIPSWKKQISPYMPSFKNQTFASVSLQKELRLQSLTWNEITNWMVSFSPACPSPMRPRCLRSTRNKRQRTDSHSAWTEKVRIFP